MSKFHHTVSRRSFMKGLGLAGAGLGTTAAAAPVFHDLDEAIASPKGEWKHAWWVKEVDQPVPEVDWNMMTYYDHREIMFDTGAFKRQIGEAEYGRLNQLRSDNTKTWMQQNKPGFTLRDRALNGATGFGYTFGMTASFLPPRVTTPDAYGMSAWQGNAEENLLMVRSAARFFGAKDLGVYELDQNTRKIVYGIETDGKAYVYRDVDVGEETDTERVIPNKAKYMIIWTTLQSQEMYKRAPDCFSGSTVSMGYSEGALVSNRLQSFLGRIGWHGYAERGSNALAQSGGSQVMAGVAEGSRASLAQLSPDRGLGLRAFKMITDLPLTPTKPIDAGMFRFCKACKTCGTYCPPGAISMDDEPTYDVQGPWNKPGIRAYYYNAVKCLTYWREITTGCAICCAVCPFNQKDTASIHAVLKPIIANSAIFNTFIANMAETFGYNERDRETQESWWDIHNAPVRGWDTTRETLKLS